MPLLYVSTVAVTYVLAIRDGSARVLDTRALCLAVWVKCHMVLVAYGTPYGSPTCRQVQPADVHLSANRQRVAPQRRPQRAYDILRRQRPPRRRRQRHLRRRRHAPPVRVRQRQAQRRTERAAYGDGYGQAAVVGCGQAVVRRLEAGLQGGVLGAPHQVAGGHGAKQPGSLGAGRVQGASAVSIKRLQTIMLYACVNYSSTERVEAMHLGRLEASVGLEAEIRLQERVQVIARMEGAPHQVAGGHGTKQLGGLGAGACVWGKSVTTTSTCKAYWGWGTAGLIFQQVLRTGGSFVRVITFLGPRVDRTARYGA